MKIKLIKDHVLGKAGDMVEVESDRANYLERVGVGVDHVESKPVPKKKAPAKKKAKKKSASNDE